MRIKRTHLRSFKRFHDLEVSGLPATTRLVVLTGPNGSGKSSLFDGFNEWHKYHGRGGSHDPLYFPKQGLAALDADQRVRLEFYDDPPAPSSRWETPKSIYVRSAYRNEPEFTMDQLRRVGPVEQDRRVEKMIDNDVRVSSNYLRLVSAAVSHVYGNQHQDMRVGELNERMIGPLRDAVGRVFRDLILGNVGDPLEDGAFYFDKGVSRNFHYKNLSGGEKAAFDLLLDLFVKREYYNDTIYCIDEPEAHMGTREQALLLEELVRMLPSQCQLWIATHSIGMMRKAGELQQARPGEVVFLDFDNRDFDQPVTMTPARADRQFWANTLRFALGDLADLVAPRQVVLCEGHTAMDGRALAEGFDAQCCTTIFGAEYPDTAFISVGNQHDVRTDRLGLGRAVEMLVPGVQVVRLVDRDDRSPAEIAQLPADVRVLSERHLEAYLMSDEVLTRLCRERGHPDKVEEVLAAKAEALAGLAARGKASDDVKAASPNIAARIKLVLRLLGAGHSPEAFMRDTLAPLITPGMATYDRLRRDVFG